MNRKCCILNKFVRRILLAFSIQTAIFVCFFLQDKRTMFGLMETVSKTSVDREEIRNCNYLALHHFMGRLGNKLFQYASLYSLAKTNKKIPVIMTDDGEMKKYFGNISVSFVNFSDKNFVPDTEEGVGRFSFNSTRMNCSENVTMTGHRQSYKYFRLYREEIRKEFAFSEHVENECREILQKSIEKLANGEKHEENCYIVGAHMRRGDFVNLTHVGHVPAEESYLRKAIDYFEKRFQNETECIYFLVLGDDVKWNRVHAPNATNVLVLVPNSAIVDMCILSKCNGSIISTGSFGWWSAYLAGGTTTYMKRQYDPNNGWFSKNFVMDEYINPKWDWIPL